MSSIDSTKVKPCCSNRRNGWHRMHPCLCNRKLNSSVCKTFSICYNSGMNMTTDKIVSILQTRIDHVDIYYIDSLAVESILIHVIEFLVICILWFKICPDWYIDVSVVCRFDHIWLSSIGILKIINCLTHCITDPWYAHIQYVWNVRLCPTVHV